MSRIRSKDTKPEMVVRRLLHGMGYRYRLHDKRLPGHPDIVFPSRRRIILVHGCFWHRHEGCKDATIPKSNTEFWTDKLTKNVTRDGVKIEQLHNLGWKVLIVWECQIKDLNALQNLLVNYLDSE